MDPDDKAMPITRRGVFKAGGTLAAGLALSPLVGCGEGQTLKFASWESYLGESTLSDFKDASGIDAGLSVIASEDALFDQLSKGESVPDVIVASNRMVERLSGAGLLLPLTKARLPNARNIDPRFADASYDPGRQFSMPYTWLVYGIGFRKSAVAKPPRTWTELLSSPAFAGRLALPADPADLFRIAARTVGKGPNDIQLSDVPALANLLKAQLPRVKAFHKDDGQDLLLEKQVDLVADFNGDIAQVILEDPDLAFVIPEDGSEITADNLCIPKGAERPGNAHAFIDFLLGGQAGMRVADTILYPTANRAAKALMPAAYQHSTVLFPPDALLAKCDFARWKPELDQAMAKAWGGIYQSR